MRRLIATVIAAALVATGLVLVASPAQACTLVQCPPIPDRQCGITGKLCKRGVVWMTPTRRI